MCWLVQVVKSYGMLGYVRVVSPLHAVYESKPDGQGVCSGCGVDAAVRRSCTRTDLRLCAPFPELLAVAEAYPWSGDDEASRKRRHDLPWPLILLEAAKLWKAQNDGVPPKGMAQKAQFKQLIQVRVHSDSRARAPNVLHPPTLHGVSCCRVWQIHRLRMKM